MQHCLTILADISTVGAGIASVTAMFLNGVGELLLGGSFLTLTCDAHKGHDCQYAIVAMTDVQVGAMYPVYHQQSEHHLQVLVSLLPAVRSVRDTWV